MKKTLKLMPEYQCYPLWLYDSDGTLIDNIIPESQWDELLSEMYDYLAGVLNADQYASEEENYKQWVAERDSGAENAASATEDSTQKQLASYSFKQSYTKARCYKLLDMM